MPETHEYAAIYPPILGDMVLYTNLGDSEGRYPPEDHPALITKVCGHEEGGKYCTNISLHIFYETGDFFMTHVPYSNIQERGHWHYHALPMRGVVNE